MARLASPVPPARGREPGWIRLEVHVGGERAGEDHLGIGPTVGVAEAHPQATRAD